MGEQAIPVLTLVGAFVLGALAIRYREAIGTAFDTAYRAVGSGVARFLRL